MLYDGIFQGMYGSAAAARWSEHNQNVHKDLKWSWANSDLAKLRWRERCEMKYGKAHNTHTFVAKNPTDGNWHPSVSLNQIPPTANFHHQQRHREQTDGKQKLQRKNFKKENFTFITNNMCSMHAAEAQKMEIRKVTLECGAHTKELNISPKSTFHPFTKREENRK